MLVYRKFITVTDPKRIVLSDTPFQPGQRVEILAIADNERTAARMRELEALFATSQALPQAREISEEEIVAEIAAYRAEQ
jgi:hypothetical protein